MNSFLILKGHALTTAMRDISESLLYPHGLTRPHALRSLDFGELVFYLTGENPADDHAALCQEITDPEAGDMAPYLYGSSPWGHRLVKVAPGLELAALVEEDAPND
jgi:hypothetical protein